MDRDTRAVWEIVKKHVGRDGAVSRKDLVSCTGISDRSVRDKMRSLRLEHSKIICYSDGKPGGYFIPNSLEEVKACRNREWSRENKVRENRRYYDEAVVAMSDDQLMLV